MRKLVTMTAFDSGQPAPRAETASVQSRVRAFKNLIKSKPVKNAVLPRGRGLPRQPPTGGYLAGMRTALTALCMIMCVGAALANPVETRDGQITCVDLESMREFVQALAAGDRQWRAQVTGCFLALPGAKLAILDRDVPNGGIPNVARVRAFRRDGEASSIGYVILEPGQ